MQEAPPEFVQGVGVMVVVIGNVRHTTHVKLTEVTGVLEVTAVHGMVSKIIIRVGDRHEIVILPFVVGEGGPFGQSQLVFHVVQPFHGDVGLWVGTTPTVEWFGGDGVGFHPVNP